MKGFVFSFQRQHFLIIFLICLSLVKGKTIKSISKDQFLGVTSTNGNCAILSSGQIGCGVTEQCRGYPCTENSGKFYDLEGVVTSDTHQLTTLEKGKIYHNRAAKLQSGRIAQIYQVKETEEEEDLGRIEGVILDCEGKLLVESFTIFEDYPFVLENLQIVSLPKEENYKKNEGKECSEIDLEDDLFIVVMGLYRYDQSLFRYVNKIYYQIVKGDGTISKLYFGPVCRSTDYCRTPSVYRLSNDQFVIASLVISYDDTYGIISQVFNYDTSNFGVRAQIGIDSDFCFDISFLELHDNYYYLCFFSNSEINKQYYCSVLTREGYVQTEPIVVTTTPEIQTTLKSYKSTLIKNSNDQILLPFTSKKDNRTSEIYLSQMTLDFQSKITFEVTLISGGDGELNEYPKIIKLQDTEEERFVVTWRQENEGTGNYGTYGKTFTNTTSTGMSGIIQIHQTEFEYQTVPHPYALTKFGYWLVVFKTDNQEATNLFVGKIYDEKGIVISNEFELAKGSVYEYIDSDKSEEDPAIVLYDNGAFYSITRPEINADKNNLIFNTVDQNGNNLNPSDDIVTLYYDENTDENTIISLNSNTFLVQYLESNKKQSLKTSTIDNSGQVSNQILTVYEAQTGEDILKPTVETLRDNVFISVYLLETSSDSDLFGKILEQDGDTHGDGFTISEIHSNIKPKIKVLLDNSEFIVICYRSNDSPEQKEIIGQIFDDNGNKIGDEILLDSVINTMDFNSFDVSVNSQGQYIVVWDTKGTASDTHRSYGQVIDKDGSKHGAIFQISSFTNTKQQIGPKVIALSSTICTMAYVDKNPNDDGDNLIYIIIYDIDSNQRLDEFPFEQYLSNNEKDPKIVSFPDDFFVVSGYYNKINVPNNHHKIHYRIFDNNGTALSSNKVATGTDFQSIFPQDIYKINNYRLFFKYFKHDTQMDYFSIISIDEPSSTPTTSPSPTPSPSTTPSPSATPTPQKSSDAFNIHQSFYHLPNKISFLSLVLIVIGYFSIF
ncbi:hypothetical protein M0812_07809 [Anaeramoeba flamelloides]|uniref:Uncharacterized protein n=1 Tax=Anaeramoeba flamelloides TaxID=1746091 RepID=A0AAV8A080_9EUKA|nr:hypothetical protein M0812_07809 [Anaeramoeba flamelloides]